MGEGNKENGREELQDFHNFKQYVETEYERIEVTYMSSNETIHAQFNYNKLKRLFCRSMISVFENGFSYVANGL